MNGVRIALAQINTTVGDIQGNADLVRRRLADARAAGADLVVFPEMTLPGYPAEDLLLRPSFIRANREALDAVLPDTRGVTAVIGFADGLETGAVRNAAAVAHDGSLVTIYHKHRLPNYGVFDEARYFEPGTSSRVVALGEVRVGLTICEDIWARGGPGEDECRRGGATVLVNPSASPFHVGKPAHRERLFGALASELGCDLLVCNLVGGQDELIFDGNSLHVGPDGGVRARGLAFEEDLLLVDVEPRPRVDLAKPAAGARARPRAGSRAIQLPPDMPAAGDLPSPETSALSAPDVAGEPRLEIVPVDGWTVRDEKSARPARPSDPDRGESAEAYGALCLGTRDYVLKNGFREVLIGLSGGIDSALTAVIAADAIGPGAVHGVGMPSGFSSVGSVTDARELARRLGIEFREIPIREPYDSLMEALTPAFEKTPFGLAEENLQARIRGNLLMALSNKFGWLVLTTGNKSEVAVGYTTLYGDTAGGLAVLKDLYKTSVYALSRYRNSLGEVIPESIIAKPPSAELRPDQKDTDSLPPYEVLDPILEAYVERDLATHEIVAMGYDRATVERVIRMVDRAEYKRRQSPPGIKITARAFGKDRRWPITSRWTIGSPSRSGH